MFFFKQNQHKLPDSNSMVIYKCWPRCKPWQIPPAHIYAWHIEQPASSMHQNPLRILSLILQQDQCRMCVNCCHLSGKVCQRGSTRCNKCEWKYCTINLGHDVACCRKHFLTYRGTFFATVMRKKLPVFTTATFSLWIYNWNIFPWRVVWLLEQHSPTPPPSCVTCSAGSRGLWGETTEGRQQTATDLCRSGWRQPWSVRPRRAWWTGGPLAPVATHPSPPRRPGRSAPRWGWTVPEEHGRRSRTGQHQWRHQVRLGYILNTAVVHPSRMVEMVNCDGKHPVTEGGLSYFMCTSHIQSIGTMSHIFCWTQRFNLHKDQRICFRWEVFMQVFDHQGAAAHK